jgi:sigma-B regulation protein RsbU (phosphoserine phosphatase)
MPDAKYVSESCSVEHSSTLYIFSDGIYEIRQRNKEFWTLAAFIALLANSRTDTSDNLDVIFQQVQAVSGCNTFEDDCSLLQVQLS